jgi:hypothetical protein
MDAWGCLSNFRVCIHENEKAESSVEGVSGTFRWKAESMVKGWRGTLRGTHSLVFVSVQDRWIQRITFGFDCYLNHFQMANIIVTWPWSIPSYPPFHTSHYRFDMDLDWYCRLDSSNEKYQHSMCVFDTWNNGNVQLIMSVSVISTLGEDPSSSEKSAGPWRQQWMLAKSCVNDAIHIYASQIARKFPFYHIPFLFLLR